MHSSCTSSRSRQTADETTIVYAYAVKKLIFSGTLPGRTLTPLVLCARRGWFGGQIPHSDFFFRIRIYCLMQRNAMCTYGVWGYIYLCYYLIVEKVHKRFTSVRCVPRPPLFIHGLLHNPPAITNGPPASPASIICVQSLCPFNSRGKIARTPLYLHRGTIAH